MNKKDLATMAGQTQEMTDSSKPKGLAARILGEQPTGLQKTFFWLMILSLTLWPLLFFVSLFFFDAPIRTTVDEISRWGMVLTIWLYPLYLLPLMRSWFQLSKCLRATWLFYLCPLIPIIIFFSFVELASSEYAAKKPKGYDPATFERLNESFASTQRNRPYCVKITNQNMTEGYKQKEYGQAVKRYCQTLDLQGSWDGSPDLF